MADVNLRIPETEVAGRNLKNAGDAADGISVPRTAFRSRLHCGRVPRRPWRAAEATPPVTAFRYEASGRSKPRKRQASAKGADPPRSEAYTNWSGIPN